VIGRHARIVLDLLGGLDLIHLGWFGMGMALWALWRGRANPGQALWAWCVLPVVCLGMVYLPVYVQRVDQRYFYGASPCLFACTAGGLGWLAQRLPRYAEWLRRGGRVVLGVAFGTPAALGLYLVLVGVSDPASVLAHDLAHRLRNAACHGPVAGSGMIAGGRAGLYAAFLLNESWYGDTPQPSAQAYFESGANLIVVPRNRSIVADLDRHPGFRDLDARLFRPGEEVSAYPLKVYSRIEVDVDGG
jgi:hypothetical protein